MKFPTPTGYIHRLEDRLPQAKEDQTDRRKKPREHAADNLEQAMNRWSLPDPLDKIEQE